jgi:vanillate/3-O-methylgallate O-demethylase
VHRIEIACVNAGGAASTASATRPRRPSAARITKGRSMSASSIPANLQMRRRPLQYHSGDIWGPPQFTSWVAEEMSWKTTCYLGDWSFLSSMRYTGPDVLQLFADCSVNSMNNFKIGQSKHLIHCNDDGKLIEEGVLTRTGEQEVIAYSTVRADYVRRNGSYDVEMEVIDEVKYHLQGPSSLFVLEKVLGREFRDISFMRNDTVTIAGVETRVLRQGMSGEIGFELQAPTAEGRKVWDAILEAGQEYGIEQLGGRVAMINHLQAAYPTFLVDYVPAVFDDQNVGYLAEMRGGTTEELDKIYWAIAGSFESDDITDYYRSPVEFGWGGRVNFDHPFPGDEALRRELESPKRTLRTLRWNGDDVVEIFAAYFRDGDLPDFMEMPQDPRGFTYFDKILKDGELVGTTSNRGYSAYFREMLSLAVVDLEHAEPGTEVTVIWGAPGTPQREIRAVVAPAPYKDVRSRVDLHTLPTR